MNNKIEHTLVAESIVKAGNKWTLKSRVAQLIADLMNQLSGSFSDIVFLWHRTGIEDSNHFVHLQVFAIAPSVSH